MSVTAVHPRDLWPGGPVTATTRPALSMVSPALLIHGELICLRHPGRRPHLPPLLPIYRGPYSDTEYQCIAACGNTRRVADTDRRVWEYLRSHGLTDDTDLSIVEKRALVLALGVWAGAR